LKDETMIEIEKEGLEKDAMYKFDGQQLIKLDINKDIIKVPITAEADAAVKELRKRVAAVMATRPDLSIVASAVLLHALDVEGIVDVVKAYGAKVYQS
jgi:hypothetical protein